MASITIYIYIYTVPWKGFPPSCFFFFFACHTLKIQIIKQILILQMLILNIIKDNPSKYKMQFWNNDLIY